MRLLLHTRLVEQTGALLEAELGIRGDEAEAVHDARVACRRIRALLATHRKAFHVEASEPLREELRSLARSLSGQRDLQVVQERLLRLGQAESVDAQFLERVRLADWSRDASTAPDAARVVESERYAALTRALIDFTAEPPWAVGAEEDARRSVRRSVRQDWRRLERLVASLEDITTGTAANDRLHDIRKAAKRTRYAVEVAEPLWTRKAKRLRRDLDELTDILGEIQDSVVTRSVLSELAARAESAGEPTDTHARLQRAEE